MDKTTPIEVFRLGTHTDRHGNVFAFHEADAQAMIAAYDATRDAAPLVLGHPAPGDTMAKAGGFATSFHLEGDVLVADVEPLPDFAEEARRGGFRKVSASFYPKGDSRSPNPAVAYPRHIALLAAHPPAVKGLRSVEFSEPTENLIEVEREEAPGTPPDNPAANPQETDVPQDKTPEQTQTHDFAERERDLSQRENALKAREEAQAKREADARHTAHLEFAEGLVKQAKLKPAGKQLVAGLLDTLAAGNGQDEPQFVEFAESDGGELKKVDPVDALKTLLNQAKPLVEFGEAAGADKEPPKLGAKDEAEAPLPAGYEYAAEEEPAEG